MARMGSVVPNVELVVMHTTPFAPPRSKPTAGGVVTLFGGVATPHLAGFTDSLCHNLSLTQPFAGLSLSYAVIMHVRYTNDNTAAAAMEPYDDRLLDDAGTIILCGIAIVLGIPIVVWLLAMFLIQAG